MFVGYIIQTSNPEISKILQIYSRHSQAYHKIYCHLIIEADSRIRRQIKPLLIYPGVLGNNIAPFFWTFCLLTLPFNISKGTNFAKSYVRSTLGITILTGNYRQNRPKRNNCCDRLLSFSEILPSPHFNFSVVGNNGYPTKGKINSGQAAKNISLPDRSSYLWKIIYQASSSQ